MIVASGEIVLPQLQSYEMTRPTNSHEIITKKQNCTTTTNYVFSIFQTGCDQMKPYMCHHGLQYH